MYTNTGNRGIKEMDRPTKNHSTMTSSEWPYLFVYIELASEWMPTTKTLMSSPTESKVRRRRDRKKWTHSTAWNIYRGKNAFGYEFGRYFDETMSEREMLTSNAIEYFFNAHHTKNPGRVTTLSFYGDTANRPTVCALQTCCLNDFKLCLYCNFNISQPFQMGFFTVAALQTTSCYVVQPSWWMCTKWNNVCL